MTGRLSGNSCSPHVTDFLNGLRKFKFVCQTEVLHLCPSSCRNPICNIPPFLYVETEENNGMGIREQYQVPQLLEFEPWQEEALGYQPLYQI